MARAQKNSRRTQPAEFLLALGERVRMLRAMRGMSRKALAEGADISERFLANLETGSGNASILLLKQLADALALPLNELLGPQDQPASGEWALIRQTLSRLTESELTEARLLLTRHFPEGGKAEARMQRIALIGLRGAGKSTLAPMLAEAMGWPAIELNHEIEKLTGMRTAELHRMLGQAAYRRYERRALEATVTTHAHAVIATPGSLVSEASTYAYLLSNCFTVWLKASPEEHMSRVIEQGDLRPMAGNDEAMDDLRRILKGRVPLYARADLTIDTSGKTVQDTFQHLLDALAEREISPPGST